ncbi:MAG TPA: aldo/keto reductase [Puia sp.]|nr:aldo/keto reductase [Puia sp.]
MEYKNLGLSGLKVPVLSLGTATFGGTNEFFGRWGKTDVKEATRLVEICMDHGVNFFDTANVYSLGASEEILGAAVKGRRDRVILSTKGVFRMGEGVNDAGASRHHLIKAVNDSLMRLSTDYIDVYFIHWFDGSTPVEETLRALDDLITSGKIRYIGCSNFAAWQLMKSLSVSERYGFARYVVYQGYYSLIGRDYEQELMPLLHDQGLGLMVWSPLGWGRLTGKIKRNVPLPEGRVKSGGLERGPVVAEGFVFDVVEVLEEIAGELGKTVPQVAINWLLGNDSVVNVVMGARNEQQLIENLGSVGWKLQEDQVRRLDAVSAQRPLYPHWVTAR